MLLPPLPQEAAVTTLTIFLMRELMLDKSILLKKDDDVQEEITAKDASGIVVDKPQKKRKRKVTGDASGYALPPKKLRDDHQSLPPRTGGKSLTVLRDMVSEGSVIPSDAVRPAVTAFVTPTLDVEPVDSVPVLNLRTRPPPPVSPDTVANAPRDFTRIGVISRVRDGGVRGGRGLGIVRSLKKPSVSPVTLFMPSQSFDTERPHTLLTDGSCATGVVLEGGREAEATVVPFPIRILTLWNPRYLTTIAERRWLLGRGLKLVLSKCLSSPKYLSAMGEAIGRAIDKGMQDGLAGIEHGVVGRSITDVAAYNPSAESDYIVAVNALQSVSFLLLAQLEAHKDASMADIIDLLRLESPTAETSEARPPQPSIDELMIPIHRLEDQVVIGETSLAFSLEVAHNRVQRLRGDATARRLSLTDSIRPLVEPLSSRILTGEASSSADVTVTTALATTFAQTFPIPAGLYTEVPPSPKIIFEEEELDTTPEHALAS
ncbi:hypothetical protein Tco_1065644 [Tanacetum coccineum]